MSNCFLEKNKDIIIFFSAEIAQRVLNINFQQNTFFFFFFFFFLFFPGNKIGISCKLSPIETVCMKCQILLAGKNEKNIIKYIVRKG